MVKRLILLVLLGVILVLPDIISAGAQDSPSLKEVVDKETAAQKLIHENLDRQTRDPLDRITPRSTLMSVAELMKQGNYEEAEERSQQEEDGWRFMLAPLYIWGVGLSGSSDLPPSDGGDLLPSLDFASPFTNLSAAFSFHFEGGKGDWILITDYLFARFKPETRGPFGLTGFSSKQDVNLVELAGAYRLFSQPAYEVELLAGARYLDLDMEVDAQNLGRVADFSKGIWDGFGGARATVRGWDKWSLTVRGDAGAGGSNYLWNVVLGIGWRFQEWGSLMLGYRWLNYGLKLESGAYQVNCRLLARGPFATILFHW